MPLEFVGHTHIDTRSQMAVDFYVESSADDVTLGETEAFSSEWEQRGPVQTHFRVLKGGLIRAVTESFFPSDR